MILIVLDCIKFKLFVMLLCHMRSSFSMSLLYHAYVYLEFLILACTIYILAPKSIENRESESARAYGRYQNVFLTDEELADLQASFPAVWGQYIEKLSEYMASTGKRYQSHAATIRRWAGEDAKKAAPPTRNRDYSVKEDETV